MTLQGITVYHMVLFWSGCPIKWLNITRGIHGRQNVFRLQPLYTSRIFDTVGTATSQQCSIHLTMCGSPLIIQHVQLSAGSISENRENSLVLHSLTEKNQ